MENHTLLYHVDNLSGLINAQRDTLV